MRIDLNSDLGESFGPWPMGQDAALMDSISSANVACGFHAGDPGAMRATIELARQKGVAIGAHPGFPDLVGFGRREIKARHRTGKGVWYAVVEVIRWEEEKRRGEAVASYEERCSGRKAAAEAARRLLQEHAHRFDENITVDAELFTDLEWGERD